jgi:hypothetical protein
VEDVAKDPAALALGFDIEAAITEVRDSGVWIAKASVPYLDVADAGRACSREHPEDHVGMAIVPVPIGGGALC